MRGVFGTIALFLLSGCVTYRPIVDHGVPQGSYDADLSQCQDLADTAQPQANNAAAGAVAGAIFGALLSRAVGLNGNQTTRVAAYGAAAGGVNGFARGSAEWVGIVNRCMAGRGYNVLN